MSEVQQLLPGDRVDLGGRSAVYITQAMHPLWPHLQLVVWKLDDGSWSHDSLAARQDVGDAQSSTPAQRTARLRDALLGEGAMSP